MKKFINDPSSVVDEMMEGLGLLYSDYVKVEGKMTISRTLDDADRVTIVAFGGSGHGPAQFGFVGDGMLDIHVVGDVFVSPGPQDVLQAVRLADKGHGVVLMVLNHAGDMLTGNMVYKLASKEGIRVSKIITQDDIGVVPRSQQDSRRGISGVVPLYHLLGAAARQGMSLEEIEKLAARYVDTMATIGVTTSSATNPQTGQMLGSFGDDDMEVGAGQHGEGGGGRIKMLSSKETVKLMLDMLVDDVPIHSGEKIFLMLNSFGTTVAEELILYKDCKNYLDSRGIVLGQKAVGRFLTTEEQTGFQVGIAKWDDQLETLWNTPVSTPYFRKNTVE